MVGLNLKGLCQPKDSLILRENTERQPPISVVCDQQAGAAITFDFAIPTIPQPRLPWTHKPAFQYSANLNKRKSFFVDLSFYTLEINVTGECYHLRKKSYLWSSFFAWDQLNCFTDCNKHIKHRFLLQKTWKQTLYLTVLILKHGLVNITGEERIREIIEINYFMKILLCKTPL